MIPTTRVWLNILNVKGNISLQKQEESIYRPQTDGVCRSALMGRKGQKGTLEAMETSVSESLIFSPTNISRMPKTKAI